MKRACAVFLFILCISFVPTTKQFIAEAGRSGFGNAESPYCQCGCPAPPLCYDESTWQVCSTPPGSEPSPECGGSLRAEPSGNSDYASIALGIFVAVYLLKRLW
jgi:hypothetical protein